MGNHFPLEKSRSVYWPFRLLWSLWVLWFKVPRKNVSNFSWGNINPVDVEEDRFVCFGCNHRTITAVHLMYGPALYSPQRKPSWDEEWSGTQQWHRSRRRRSTEHNNDGGSLGAWTPDIGTQYKNNEMWRRARPMEARIHGWRVSGINLKKWALLYNNKDRVFCCLVKTLSPCLCVCWRKSGQDNVLQLYIRNEGPRWHAQSSLANL